MEGKDQSKALNKTDVMQSVLKENDCRYGNYIIFGGSITQLNEKEMCHFFRFPETYKPIPLTEEWLLKFRFKEIVFTQDRNREWLKMFEIEETDELFSLCFYPEKNICYLNFDVGYGNNVLNIEFVHKLQNLYFALTGSELTVA